MENMAPRIACEYNDCGKSFTSKQSLATHHRSEHHAQKIECRMGGCLYKATDASNLRRHRKMQHSVITAPHTCTHCFKTFGNRPDNLKRHEAVCSVGRAAASAALPMAQSPGTVAATTVPTMGNIVAAPQPPPPQQQQQQQQQRQQLPTPPADVMGYTAPLVPVPWDDLIDPELFASHFPDPAADAAAAAVADVVAAAALPTPPDMALGQWLNTDQAYYPNYPDPATAAITTLPELAPGDWAGLDSWNFAHIAPAAPADLGFGPAFTAEQWEQAERMVGFAAGPFVMPEFADQSQLEADQMVGVEQQPLGELSFDERSFNEQFGDFVDLSGGVSLPKSQ